MERPVGESDEIRGRRSYMGRTGIQMLVRESIKKKVLPMEFAVIPAGYVVFLLA